MDKKQIAGITLGIRYNRSFRIPDISGDIIDNIIRDKNSPFNEKMFPKIRESALRERLLINEETEEYLRINTDDIIISIKIDNNFDKKFAFFKNEVIPYYKNILFNKYKIENIKRIGVVYHHNFNQVDKLSDVIKGLSDNKIDNVNNINLSFSKKLQNIESVITKDINNYKNTIYTFEQIEDKFNFNFDYQYYFDPSVQDLRNTNIDNIFDESLKYLEDSVHNNWLNYDENKNK